MVLGVPVFALRNANTDKLIKHNDNGYIVDNDDNALYDGLIYLLKNEGIIEKFKDNLINYSYDNNSIIKSIENLLD